MAIFSTVLLVGGAFVTRAWRPFTPTMRLSAAGVVLVLLGFELVGHG